MCKVCDELHVQKAMIQILMVEIIGNFDVKAFKEMMVRIKENVPSPIFDELIVRFTEVTTLIERFAVTDEVQH